VPLPPAAAARAGRRAQPGTVVCQAIISRASVYDVARRVLRSRSSLSASNHSSMGGLADQKPAKVQLLCTQRCMLSGTSIPSSIAHTRKKRHIERNCRARARALSASSGAGARQDSGLRWLRDPSAARNGPDLEIHEPERHVAAPSNLPPGHDRVLDGIPRAVVVHRHVAAPALRFSARQAQQAACLRSRGLTAASLRALLAFGKSRQSGSRKCSSGFATRGRAGRGRGLTCTRAAEPRRGASKTPRARRARRRRRAAPRARHAPVWPTRRRCRWVRRCRAGCRRHTTRSCQQHMKPRRQRESRRRAGGGRLRT
jgi:hypothetical protein